MPHSPLDDVAEETLHDNIAEETLHDNIFEEHYKTTSPEGTLETMASQGTSSPTMLSLQHLVGGEVSGRVARTSPDYWALLVDRVTGIPSDRLDMRLVQMAHQIPEGSRCGVEGS